MYDILGLKHFNFWSGLLFPSCYQWKTLTLLPSLCSSEDLTSLFDVELNPPKRNILSGSTYKCYTRDKTYKQHESILK